MRSLGSAVPRDAPPAGGSTIVSSLLVHAPSLRNLIWKIVPSSICEAKQTQILRKTAFDLRLQIKSTSSSYLRNMR
jgi:hypothetical protein